MSYEEEFSTQEEFLSAYPEYRSYKKIKQRGQIEADLVSKNSRLIKHNLKKGSVYNPQGLSRTNLLFNNATIAKIMRMKTAQLR